MTGIIAGYFLILQGNVKIEGFIISYIGPKYEMWEDGTYFAMTIIPNFLITGILAIIVSTLVIIWSFFFVHKKYGSLILFLLSIIQLLVGGGFTMDLATVASLVGTQINNPLIWWRKHLSDKIQRAFSQLWPYAFITYMVLSMMLNLLSILGVNDVNALNLMLILAAVLFVPIILNIFGAFAFDIQNQTRS